MAFIDESVYLYKFPLWPPGSLVQEFLKTDDEITDGPGVISGVRGLLANVRFDLQVCELDQLARVRE